jgi:RNA ligase (TIGR02306 family)
MFNKYEPPIPPALSGEVFNIGQRFTISFDVENWKSYPDILKEGEEVIFTEKIHGTCTVVAILPYNDAHPEAFGEKKNILIFSKGLGAKGLVFKNNERNKNNLYVRATRKLISRIDEIQRDNQEGITAPNFILGETFGPGVQDLSYGKEIGFRVFAAAYGYRGDQHYQNWSFVDGSLKKMLGFETVPVLYRGPFSVEVMCKYTDGKTTMGANHIREGIVMVPSVERCHPAIGRVCLKSVSADYLTRKGGTEYN